MSSDNVAILSLAFLVAAAVLLRPVFRAWARRLEGGAASSDVQREMDELRERVAELEGDHGHLQELAERVDFAERMLAQRNEPARLPADRSQA
jgi:hypothetical protein